MRHPTLLIALAVGLAACAPKDNSTAATSAKGGTFVFAGAGNASEFFPPLVTETNGRVVQDLVFDHLADIGPNLSTIGDDGFTPHLAKSWTWAPDSMSIAFHIDPNARWHDGKPVTASDVRYSFKVFADPKVGSPAAPLIGNIDSVAVRDSVTAVAYFKKHTPDEFFDITYQIIIVPEHIYGGIAPEALKTSAAARTPIGSGRYRFVKSDPATGIVLVADTGNYRGRPNFDRVILTPTDPPAAMAQLLTGDADFMEAVPADAVPRLDSSKTARPVVAPNLAFAYMAMNLHAHKSKTAPHPILGDVRVRRALSMGVDRQSMLQNVFGSLGHISHGPFPSVLAYADTNLRPAPYDTTAAKALLDSAGWRAGTNGIRAKNGVPLRFSLMVPTTSVPRLRYSVLIQAQLQKIGAQVDIEQVDAKTFIARYIGANDYDAALASFGPDPNVGGLRQLWSTSALGAQNAFGYSNKQVDALLDSADAAFDPARAKAYASRASTQIMADAPAIFLYDYAIVDGISRRINAAPISAIGWAYNFSDWSVPPDKRIARDKIGVGAGPAADTAKKP